MSCRHNRTNSPKTKKEYAAYIIVALVMQMKLRIRDLREDRDIRQQQVARDLRCDQSLLSKYERGERELPLRLAVRLAQYYGVSLDYLAGLTDDPAPPKRAN